MSDFDRAMPFWRHENPDQNASDHGNGGTPGGNETPDTGGNETPGPGNGGEMPEPSGNSGHNGGLLTNPLIDVDVTGPIDAGANVGGEPSPGHPALIDIDANLGNLTGCLPSDILGDHAPGGDGVLDHPLLSIDLDGPVDANVTVGGHANDGCNALIAADVTLPDLDGHSSPVMDHAPLDVADCVLDTIDIHPC